MLDVPRPDPGGTGGRDYQFERPLTHHDDGRQTTTFVDLYRRGCFILEAKQGANPVVEAKLFRLGSGPEQRRMVRHSPGWTQQMLRAKGQAEGYVRDLPGNHAAPPFLIACDVGFCIDLYADFSGTGRHYVQFPARTDFRIHLTDLTDPDVRTRLATIWTDPCSLDPSRQRTEVTREIATLLATLATTLEQKARRTWWRRS